MSALTKVLIEMRTHRLFQRYQYANGCNVNSIHLHIGDDGDGEIDINDMSYQSTFSEFDSFIMSIRDAKIYKQLSAKYELDEHDEFNYDEN